MDPWGWLDPRAGPEGELWRRQFGGGGGGGGDGGFDDNGLGGDDFRGFRMRSNSSSAFINELRFQAAKSIRTSTIILSVFNVIAAFATAVGILWDGYATAKRNDPKFRFRTSGFTFVGSAETFPLVLSCGIVIQGIVFAVAQSTGLEGTLVLGCTITSQLMLPAVFIVPYIQLIFGLEVTLRAIQRQPFMPRGKWSVSICLSITGTLLLISYIITHFIRPPNFCFASLFWFVQTYKEGCFAVLLIIAVVLLLATVFVFMRLHRNSRIDSTERVSASRMVYYMAVAVISTTLLIPFFFVLSFYDQRGPGNNSALQLSMVASVVANVSGLMTGGLHLFFRSNTLSTIGPKHKEDGKCAEIERQNFKRGIRLWSPRDNNGDMGRQMAQPLGSPALQRMNSNDTLIDSERDAVQTNEKAYESGRVNPLRSNAVYTAAAVSGLMAPAPIMAKPNHSRKGSYSLFPGGNPNTKSVGVLPATTYDPESKEMMVDDTLKPPAPVTVRHRRDSSLASHTTVQIGIRLSNVDDMPPLDSKYFDANRVHNLDCPNAINKSLSPTKRPSPLSNVHHEEDRIDDDEDTMVDDNRKTLPGLPGPHAKDCTLSPTVYTPQSPTKAKVTSPKGVGFAQAQAQGQRSNVSSPREAQPLSHLDCKNIKEATWV